MVAVNNPVLNSGICVFNLGLQCYFQGELGATGLKEWLRGTAEPDEVTWLINAFSQSTSIYWAGEGAVWRSLDKEADKTDMAPALTGHQNSGGTNHFVKQFS